MKRLLFLSVSCILISPLGGMDIFKFTKKKPKSIPVTNVYVKTVDGIVEIPQWQVGQIDVLQRRLAKKLGDNSENNPVDISDIKITFSYIAEAITNDGTVVQRVQSVENTPLSSAMLKILIKAFQESSTAERFKAFFNTLGGKTIPGNSFNPDKKNLINTAEALKAEKISTLAIQSIFPQELQAKMVIGRHLIAPQELQDKISAGTPHVTTSEDLKPELITDTHIAAVINHLKKPQRLFLGGHTKAVTSVVCSPLTNLIISGSQDGSVVLWDTNTGKIQKSIPSIDKVAVNCVACSPDDGATEYADEMVVGYANNTLVLFSKGKIVKTFKYTASATCITYSPDGKYITVGFGDGSVMWLSKRLNKKRRIQQTSMPINSLVYNPQDGNEVMASSQDSLVVYKKNKKENKFDIYREIINKYDKISCSTYYANGEAIVCVSAVPSSKTPHLSNKIVIVNKKEYAPLYTNPLSGHVDSNIRCITHSPKGPLLLGSANRKLIILRNMNKPSEIIQLNSKANCVAYSQDGSYFVAGLNDGTITLYPSIDEEKFNLFADYMKSKERTSEQYYFVYRLYKAAIEQKQIVIDAANDPDYAVYKTFSKDMQKTIKQYFPFKISKSSKKSVSKK